MKEVIIISSFLWHYHQVVYITDGYAFKEMVLYDTDDRIKGFKEAKDTIYEIYDLDQDIIHKISYDEDQRIIIHVDSMDEATLIAINRRRNIVRTRLKEKRYESYLCKEKIETIQYSSMYEMGLIKEYDHHYYFAQIALLDSVLNTDKKLEFVGFFDHQFAPYNYLIYDFTSSKQDSTEVIGYTTVKKGFYDPSLFLSLLKLPEVKYSPGFYGYE